MEILGIDIGGSGINGAIVETSTGTIVSEKFRTATPNEATPHKIMAKVHEVTRHFGWTGPIGCAFPAPIVNGIIIDSLYLDPSWDNADIEQLLFEITDNPVYVINDADAAGMAEMRFGAGKGREGVVIVLTVGTGIGSAIFVDGRLVPNVELGKIEIRGITAQERASERIKKEEGLKKSTWAKRIELVLGSIERIFYPDLFIFAGGVSKKIDKINEFIDIKTPFVAADLLNNAGLIGAAMYAESKLKAESVQMPS